MSDIPTRRYAADDRAISACASGWSASSFSTRSVAESSNPVTVNPLGVARFAIGPAPLSKPLSASLTRAALAASRCARSRSDASRIV